MEKSIIYEAVQREVLKSRGVNCWLSRKYSIWDRLTQLNPSKPEDGDTGKIAFNVPNKDRMKIKTGKFLTRKLNLNNGFLTDQQLQSIGGVINKRLFPDINIKLVNGPEITENYWLETGSVSCMTPSGSGGGPDCTLLYEQNPERFQMLTMHYFSDSARAIVHTFDNGQKMMDRVYSSSEQLKAQMKDYACEQNWLIGYGVNIAGSTWKISDLEYQDGHIPYMDTMIWGEINSSGLLNISAYSGYDYELCSTDGSLVNGVLCEQCGESVCEDEQRQNDNGDAYCVDCFNELYSFCEHCSEYYIADEVVHIEDKDIYVCDYCATNNFYQCEECGQYFSEITHIEDKNFDVCEGCMDDYSFCEDCGTFNKDMTYIKSEDEYVCDENCVSNYYQCKKCDEYFVDVPADGLCEDCEENRIPVACKLDDTGNLFESEVA